MSTPTWAYQLKPPFHGLSLNKSPIKNHATLFGSSYQIESNKTKLHKAQQIKVELFVFLPRLLFPLTSDAKENL